MKVWLVRHGQTDWNLAGRIQGQTDTELNDAGRAQAHQLGESLLAESRIPKAVYSSPQKRALETAEIVGGYFRLKPTPVEDFREIFSGSWEGLTWEEIQGRWPEEYAYYMKDRYSHRQMDGESLKSVIDRTLAALEKIKETGQEPVLVVTHSAVINGLCCYLAGDSFARLSTYSLGNGGWMEIEI